MRKFILLFCCLLFLAVLIYFLPRESFKTNSQSSNSAGFVDKSRGAVSNSKVYSEKLSLKYNGEDLRGFTLSQPLPKIWLVTEATDEFGNQNERKIEISQNARNILYQHWIKALEFRYITEVEEISEDVNYDHLGASLLNSTIKTEDLLLQTSIDEENKSRNFTADEASQILIIIRNKADQVIKEVKEIDTRKND